MSKVLGKPVLAPVRKRIGKDISSTDAMELSVGKNWPSLAYDFGVSHTKDPDTGSVLEEMEFKADWNKEKLSNFSGILRFAPHFETLGLSISALSETLNKMRQVEGDMFDGKINPYPSAIYGKAAIIRSNQDREAASVMARNSFVFHFNKLMDENELYVRFRFEGKSGPKDLNQNLVFTFPTSNEQREIWRHVFWGYEYPADGIPMNTNYARPANTSIASMQQQNGSLSELAALLGSTNIRDGQPPPYNRTPSLMSGGR